MSPSILHQFKQDAEKVASLSCSCGLFGLSGVFGCMRRTRWTRQTGFALDAQVFEVLLC
jgi:hypothetical protein